ncbi:hypothetical protein ACTGZQ_04120 [Streptococcus suis]
MVKKYRFILLGLIFLVLIGASWSYHNLGQESVKSKKEIETVEAYLPLADGSMMLRGEGEPTFSEDYLIASSMYYRHTPYSSNFSIDQLSEEDFSIVEVYSAKVADKKIRTFDLISLTQAFNKNYIPVTKGDTLLRDAEGLYYIRYSADDISKVYGDSSRDHLLILDLQSGEVFEEDWSKEYWNADLFVGLDIFSPLVTDVGKKLEEMNISLSLNPYNKEVVYGIEFNSMSDLSQVRLMDQNPDVAKFAQEGATYFWVDKNMERLAYLLGTDKENDIFEGVTLYGEYAKDGQEHVVQSYQELMQWYQDPEEVSE